jgi:SAM-dependent methyltransferase
MVDDPDREMPHGTLPRLSRNRSPALAAVGLPDLLIALLERLRARAPFDTAIELIGLGDAVQNALVRAFDLPAPRAARYPLPQVYSAFRRWLPRRYWKGNPGLAAYDPVALCNEILHRLTTSASSPAPPELHELGTEVVTALEQVLEVPENRFSRHRLWAMFNTFHRRLRAPKPPVKGATYLELGCGSINPLGVMFLFKMLGARQAIAIDPDPVENASRARQGLAQAADRLLESSGQIVGRYPITRDEILQNLRGIDLERLRAGDAAELEPSLVYRNESAYAVSVEDQSVDVVLSNSFLEHVEDIDGVIAEMARVTRPGGFGVHSIDGNDHRIYGDGGIHSLDFLRQEAGGMVHGSNRIRPLEFPALFARRGFTFQQLIPRQTLRVTSALRASLAEPWRDMPKAMLRVKTGILVVRKT